MQQGEMRAMDKDDLVIAISFDPYAQETIDVVNTALSRKARLLAITDSQFSPVATHAEVVLLVQESGTFGFRSLTSTMCVAQALFLSLAYRMELAGPVRVPGREGKNHP
jgi:DNA-binding MurR/RpiR family transcriptional regulator